MRKIFKSLFAAPRGRPIFYLVIIFSVAILLANIYTLVEEALNPEAHSKHFYVIAGGIFALLTAVLAGGLIFYMSLYMRRLKNALNERKTAAETLQKERDRAQNYLDVVRVIILLIDADQKVSHINKKGCEILGYKEHEILGKNWFNSFIPENDRGKIKMVFNKLMAGEIDMYEYFEYPVLAKSGEERVIAWHNASLKGESGKIIGTLSSGEDITEQKWIIDELRKSEAQFRAIFDDAAIGMALVDMDGALIISNSALQQMLAYDVEELNSMRFIEFIHPEEVKEKRELYKGMIEGSYDHYKTTKRCMRKNGNVAWCRLNASLIKDSDGRPRFSIFMVEDITERKQAEEERTKLEAQLRHAQKMEAIGTLAGGIAHDFNNILTAIMGYGNLLKMKMKEDDNLRTYVDPILASSVRAANLTQSLLTFSRKQAIDPRPVNLNDIVKNVERLLLRLISEDIELKTMLAGDTMVVMADIGQVEQVLINLATNARDAMPDGGVLTIKTERVELTDDFITAHNYGNRGTYALISFSDTGVGMDESTKERIFEPFFTTKTPGRGTGLGLSIVYGIVKQHSGYIDVQSEWGNGATFKMYLPVIKAEIEKKATERNPALSGGSETVLVAEDEAGVRNVTKSVLQLFGYDVIEAIDGEDAINKFQEHKDKIRLLVADVIMPKKNGKEVYEAIKKLKPDIKALFTTGYPADVIGRKGLLEDGINLLLKPVSPADLLKNIRTVLDN